MLSEVDRTRRSDEQKLTELVDIFNDVDPILTLLLQIKTSPYDKRDLLKLCAEFYAKSNEELERVRDFEHLYSSSKVLEYFFDETFLYRLLLKSLHVLNVDLLFLLRFFLQDMEKQLCSLPPLSGQVYRGQFLTTQQLECLFQSTEKSSIRFNTYVVASPHLEPVRQSLQISYDGGGLQRVLFKIDDPMQAGRQYKQHCLFPITTTFQVVSVQFEQRMWIAQLVANSNCKPNEYEQSISPIALAQHLRETNRLDQSKKLYRRLLAHYPALKTQCYDGLGRVAQEEGLYDVSLKFYFDSLESVSQTDRIHCLNNIACVYDYLERAEQALDFYGQALSLEPSQLEQSMCLNNMAITYAKSGQAEQALKCFEQALSIRKRLSSDNPAELGAYYTNIGMAYSSLGREDDALENYNLALRMFTSTNSFHVPRAILYQDIANIYQSRAQLDQAVKLYRQAKELFEQVGAFHHPNFLYGEEQLARIQQRTC